MEKHQDYIDQFFNIKIKNSLEESHVLENIKSKSSNSLNKFREITKTTQQLNNNESSNLGKVCFFMKSCDQINDDTQNKKISNVNDISTVCLHKNKNIEQGSIICIDCGIIIKNKCSTYDKEWRYYGDNDTRRNSNPSRVNKRQKNERNIKKDIKEMGFPDDIIQEATKIYLECTDGQIYRGKSRKSIVFGSIYYAYKKLGKPKSHDSLIRIFDLTRKIALKGLKHISLNTKKTTKINKTYITPIYLIEDIMKKFTKNKKHIKSVIDMYNEIKNRSSKLNRARPQSVSSGLIYYWIKKNNIDIDITQFIQQCNLSQLTVIKMTKEITNIYLDLYIINYLKQINSKLINTYKNIKLTNLDISKFDRNYIIILIIIIDYLIINKIIFFDKNKFKIISKDFKKDQYSNLHLQGDTTETKLHNPTQTCCDNQHNYITRYLLTIYNKLLKKNILNKNFYTYLLTGIKNELQIEKVRIIILLNISNLYSINNNIFKYYYVRKYCERNNLNLINTILLKDLNYIFINSLYTSKPQNDEYNKYDQIKTLYYIDKSYKEQTCHTTRNCPEETKFPGRNEVSLQRSYSVAPKGISSQEYNQSPNFKNKLVSSTQRKNIPNYLKSYNFCTVFQNIIIQKEDKILLKIKNIFIYSISQLF